MYRKEITQNIFITTKNIKKLSKKLASNTYMLHKSNAQSVQMWVYKNYENMFCYTKANLVKLIQVIDRLDS